MQAVWETVSCRSGFSGVRMCRFPSRNSGWWLHIHHKPALFMTVCLQGQWEGILGQPSAKPSQGYSRAACAKPTADWPGASIWRQVLMLPPPCPFLASFQEIFWHSLAANHYLIVLIVAFAGTVATWKTRCPFTRRKLAVRNIPQCLCFLQLLQSSLVAPKFCPLCHQSCRSNANWIPQGHSFWQISQTLPYKERILILYKAVLPAQQFLVLDGSLRAKIWVGKSKPLNQLFIMLKHCLSL